MFLRKAQAGAVAGGQQLAVALGEGAGDDRADRMQHMPGREVVAPGQLGLSGGLLMPLGAHQSGALLAQLQARRGVDHISDPYQNHTLS